MNRVIGFGIATATTLCLAACSPSPSAAVLDELVPAAAEMLKSNEPGSVPVSRWPVAVARYKPERAYITGDGLYLVTSSTFVEERGLFFPRAATFKVDPGGDPSYNHIRPGAFSYHIKG